MSNSPQNINETKVVKSTKSGAASTDSNKDFSNLPLNQKQIERGHELSDWFIFRETRHFGPLSTKHINQLLLSRLISNNHYIWRPGFTSWLPINSIETFRAFGHNEIDKISDNDFSFQAALGPIDRIKFQENDVSFQESSGAKILNINVQNMQTEIYNKFDNFKNSSRELLNELLFTFGISDIHKKKIVYGLSFLSLMFVASILYLAFSGTNKEFFVDQLPREMRETLTSNANLVENNFAPSLIFLEKDAKLEDPMFVGSVNLPVGSRLKVLIKGVPKTLLGSFRFSKEFEIVLSSHYFQTEAIRGPAGRFLSPGKYNVSVTCLTCEKENLNLHSSVFNYGIKNFEVYNKELKAFHLNSRESAILELDELRDLNDTLLDQYQTTVGMYNRSIGNKSASAWNKFSTQWLSTQKKIVELFEQIQSEDLKSKLYYLSLYEAYGSVTRMIFELHVMQDKHMMSGKSESSLIEQIVQSSQDIKLKLTYIKSQTDLMRINYNRSSGLPSKEGMNLNKFE